jgi:hypothetical protein
VGPDLTVLVPARDEEERIADTVRALRAALPGAQVIVADDGSRDRTAQRAEDAGAVVLRLPRRGKGEALTAAERAAPAGRLLLVDADLRGDARALLDAGADLAVAAFARRRGGGFGIAKGVARLLVRARTGVEPREPLSGQRALSPAARAACFPLAPGFGCEVRMTIDALRAGLAFEEVEVDLDHRPTGRDAAGFLHRGRQLAEAVLAAGPLATNYRGRRLPLVGWWAIPLLVARGSGRVRAAAAAVALAGLADDLWSGPERGIGAHLAARRTTGVLKAVTIPLAGAVATRSLSGGLLAALAANAFNQLDTRPGRALKAFLLAAPLAGGPALRGAAGAVLLLPYDLRERAMLGDGGSNALGAVIGLGLVARLRGGSRWAAIATLAGLNLLGERRSLGTLIETTPGLAGLDALGRAPRGGGDAPA